MSRGLAGTRHLLSFIGFSAAQRQRHHSPVGKQLAAANGARNHLVDVFRGLILAVDFLIFPVEKLRGDQAGMPGDGAELVRSGGREGDGNGADLVAPTTEVLSDWASVCHLL